MPVKNRIMDLLPDMIQWRHEFHSHPELGFNLPGTTALVEAFLHSFGILDVTTGVGGAGIVAVIAGQKTSSNRVIALRVDMDALPIDEATGLPYASTTAGMMHACGHDGHIAILLGVAHYLNETRNFDGKVVLVFEPAEEIACGAKAMIEDGLMERWGITEIYGLHCWPTLPVGHFAIRPGPFLSSSMAFDLAVRGSGGFASEAHLATDVVVAAAAITLAVIQDVSAIIPAKGLASISMCGVSTGQMSHNILPKIVEMSGSIRSLNAELIPLMKAQIEATLQRIAGTYGVTTEISYLRELGVTFNDKVCTRHAIKAAEHVSGRQSVIPEYRAQMGAEDFSAMLAARPGAYIFLGNGDSAQLHNPGFDFNDQAIPYGVNWFVTLAEQRMPLVS